MKSAEYRAVHPMGRVPAVVDGDVTIFEAEAIVEYVLEQYDDGRLRPDFSSPSFPDYLQCLHYAEGMLMPPVNIIVVETLILPEERRNQTNVDRAQKLLSQMLGAVAQGLEGKECLAGEFSGADIMTGHACIVSARLDGDISDKPNVSAYIDRLQARPALQKLGRSSTPRRVRFRSADHVPARLSGAPGRPPPLRPIAPAEVSAIPENPCAPSPCSGPRSSPRA